LRRLWHGYRPSISPLLSAQILIDRTFGLDDLPQALAYVGEGRALGKVVIEPT
jgi:hypothetical protein